MESVRERASIGPMALKDPESVEYAYQLTNWIKWLFSERNANLGRWEAALQQAEEHRVYARIPPDAPYGSLDAMLEAEIGLGRDAATSVVLLKNGGDRRSEAFQFDNYQTETHNGGTDSAYLMARMKRDAPDIAAALARGEYRSVRQAAIAAGAITPKPTVTHLITPEAFARSAGKYLSDDQLEQLIALLENEFKEYTL